MAIGDAQRKIQEIHLKRAKTLASQLAGAIQAAFNSSQPPGWDSKPDLGAPKIDVHKVGNKYVADITFPEDMSPSLYPEGYPGGADLIVLYNNGVDADGVVYGEWHNAGSVMSRPSRGAAQFIQDGVAAFGSHDGVTVEISGKFTM